MLRILLVDDEDLELHGLVAMIGTFGLPFEVCATARNGNEGLQKARQYRPHVILSDLRMPQMGGVEMLRQLCADASSARFVLISGFEDFSAAREVLELGAVAYLLKPVGHDDLFRVLSKCSAAPGNSALLNSAEKRQPLFSHQEEQFMRHLLFASEEQAAEMLTDQSGGGIFPAKTIFCVATVEIRPANGRDIYDCLPLLHAFAKEHSAPAPAPVDNAQCAIVISAPAFVQEHVFIDNVIKKAERLLLELSSIGVEDVFVGISNVDEASSALPTLYRQSVLTLKQRNMGNVSHVLFYDGAEKGPAVNHGQADNHVISLIQRIIEGEYAKPISIDAIAERLFMSPSHIRRLFKSKTGVTIMDYLEAVRLDRSRCLLALRSLKIHEIGSMVGYESPSYFNVVFKKYYGLTPGDYRKSTGI